MGANKLEHFYTPSDEVMAFSLYITWAGKMLCETDYLATAKRLDGHVLLYVESGQGFVSQGGSEVRKVEQGSAIIIFPREKYRLSSDIREPWKLSWVAFGGMHVDKILESLQISVQNCTVEGLDHGEISKIMDSLVNAVGIDFDKCRFEALGYLMLLLARVGQIKNVDSKKRNDISRDQIVPVAVRFIDQHYYTHLDVDLLCSHVNYSRSYLSRLFNDQIGMTIPEYINFVRVHHARELLEKTTLSVQEVSASVGVKDSFYFSKTFKKITGYAPNHYKKKFGSASFGKKIRPEK